MKIRLHTDLTKDSILAEVDYEVHPRSERSKYNEIVMAGAHVGFYYYEIDSVYDKNKQLFKVCMFADTIEKVREFAEIDRGGVGYLDAIRMQDNFGIMINPEKLGMSVPDFTSPIVSVRGVQVGRMAVGGRRASLFEIDELLMGEKVKVDAKSFRLRIAPADTPKDKLVAVPDWMVFLEEEGSEGGTE